MPIDARIPLMGQTAERIDPFASLGKILQIKEYQQQSEDRDTARAKQQRFDALAQQFGDDPETFVKEVSRLDPKMGATMAKLYAETQKEQFSAYEKRLDSETKQLELATRELQAVADGDVSTAAAWRAKWVTRDPQFDKILPPPEALAQPDVKSRVLQLGVSMAVYQAAEVKAMESFIKGDYRKGLGNTLAVAPSLEAAKATIAEAKTAVPKSAQGDVALFEGLLAQANGDLAAFQAAAGNAALDAKDRATIAEAQTDNARQDAAQRETARHNRSMEGGLSGARAETARHNRAMESADGGEGGGAGQGEMVTAIMANPAIYAGLTPTAKTKLAVPLAKAGFKGFGADGKAGPDVTKIMDEIETLGKRIFTSSGGPIANITGAFRTTAAKANWDNDVAEYNALVEGMIPMVARANGHVGVLTQQDVDSTRALFGKVSLMGTDNATLAQNKIDRVKRLIKGGSGGTAPVAAPAEAAPKSYSVTAPNGKTYTFKTAGELAAFKARAKL